MRSVSLIAGPNPVAAAVATGPDLGAKETPHPGLPGEHFAAALVFFVLGAGGLVFVAPDLAKGMFFLPRVVAVVHLFVLGWIVLSIFGALCQFLPVAIGKSLRWPALAHVSFGAQVAGVLVFVGALLADDRAWLHAGAALLTCAFLLFALNLSATLLSATARPLTFWALAGATVFLVVTPAYGVMLALNLHGVVVLGDRFATVASHAHVALLGFVLLVVVGVAHRLLPMFLLTHGVGERWAWASVVLLFSGAAVLAVPLGGGLRFGVAFVLSASGVLAFLLQAASHFRHRRRKALDPGMRLAAVGLLGLLAALGMAPFALGHGLQNLNLLAGYFVVLVGALSLFVAGHYFKIVPFIVWYHRFGPLVGLRKVPKVAELYPERTALLDGALLAGGWLGLAIGICFGIGWMVRASALLFASGAVLEATLIARVAQRRPA